MMQKHVKMTETLAHGYSSESTQPELSNEYQQDRVFKNCLHPCAFESSLSIGRVNVFQKLVQESLIQPVHCKGSSECTYTFKPLLHVEGTHNLTN